MESTYIDADIPGTATTPPPFSVSRERVRTQRGLAGGTVPSFAGFVTISRMSVARTAAVGGLKPT